MLNRLKVLSLTIFPVILIFTGCKSVNDVNAISASGTQGVVVASHQIPADIGLAVLKSGGNAIDAAVATGLALGVVDQFNSGLGAGGFIIIRMANGTIYTIDGRETAPMVAKRDMYIRDGEFDPELSQVGPLAVGVPGILAAYGKALELAGTKPLPDLITPSIKLAKNGFKLDGYYISRYNEAVEKLKKFPASAEIYFNHDGTPLEEGYLLIQPDLAHTYEKIAEGGLDYFYRGEFAMKLVHYMKQNGGLISYDDMANYSAKLREPIIGKYHDYDIIGMIPPSSGGVLVLEILNMLEASGILDGKSEWDEDTIYRMSLFMKKAFEDRAVHLGDVDFYPVPVKRLTSQSYADSCVNAIMRGQYSYSNDILADLKTDGHTTSYSVIDKWGNTVVVNQTANLTFGSKITLPGTGVILNNQMDDFSAQPGVPNYFDLIGSEANSIAPGKRPLSSMSPTIVVKDGKPVILLGGAGGPKIITGVVHTIIGVLDFDMSLQDALTIPRFHHQYRPESLYIEESMPELLQQAQFNKGYEIVLKKKLGRIYAIAWNDMKQAYLAVADPRSRGGAAAY